MCKFALKNILEEATLILEPSFVQGNSDVGVD